jgi:hypothetical protein
MLQASANPNLAQVINNALAQLNNNKANTKLLNFLI